MVPLIFIAVWSLAQSFQFHFPKQAAKTDLHLSFIEIINSNQHARLLKFPVSCSMTNQEYKGDCYAASEFGKLNPLLEINPYPVQSCEKKQKKKLQHLSLATSYGRYFLSVAGVPGCDRFDETAIISLLRSNYLSAIRHVHLVLEHVPDTSSSPSNLKEQLSALTTRFKTKELNSKQVNQVMDYAYKIDYLRNIPGLDRVHFEKVLLGITYKLVVDEIDSRITRLNQRNLKAWLAFALPVLGQTDSNLTALKARLGDYQMSFEWKSELHVNSFAKHSARRIYRNRKTSTVIAETLDEDGRVLETELIEELPSGALNFAAFDADGNFSPFGMIRNHRGQSVIRLAPDVCFGCHYNTKTGQFNVLRPSFIDLNLKDFDFANQGLIKRRMELGKPGERTVLHK